MKFSFIIPVYNCEQFLEKIIQKIENIKLQDYEIILVDDGSTDNSGDICDKLTEKNKKIYCIHQKNQGVSSARNRGLQAAIGEYVIFFDADDEIESQKFYQLANKLKKQSNIDIIIFGISFDYYHNGKLYRREEIALPFQNIQDSTVWAQNMYELYCRNALSPIWNKIFRRSFLIRNDLYLREDMFLFEDFEYSVRCMGYCNQILFEPEIIYHYRQSEKSGNMGRHLMKIEHIFTLINQLEKTFNQLIQNKKAVQIEKDVKNILLSLYIVLARGKIAVSNSIQIKQICDDFICWYQDKDIDIPLENQKFVDLLLKKDVKQLILRRKYIKIRHEIAVSVKNTWIYQKLKG